MRLPLTLFVLTTSLAPGFATAATIEFGDLRWRALGPNRGGRSQAAAGSVKRPLEYYFGATGGGLWKTSNGGVTWAPVTDGQIRSSSVGAVAVAESNPDIVYVGMGETEFRGNVMQGNGVYKSTDGGKTWKHSGLADSQAIARIRIDPANPDIVFAAVFGHPYDANPERGVYKSTDGGATWKRVLYRNDHSGAVDLTMDPRNPGVLFASTWDAYRTPWLLSSGGPGSGLFKTTDGGDTWTEITRNPGLPKGIVGKITVSVSGADSSRVYAVVEADDGGVFVSNDAGATWTRSNEERKIRQRAFYFSRILADPKDRDVVYAMNVDFYRSKDGGKTFDVVRTPHGDHHDFWIAADNPQRMITANDGGASVSTDGGLTWTLQKQPTAQLYHVATTNEIPYHVCGAQQDDGTICVPGNRAQNMHEPGAPVGDWMYSAGGGEAGYVTPDPKDPNIFYAGDQAGVITRYDRRTGETRNVHVYPLFFSGMSAGVLRDRWQWTFPIVFSPLEPGTLYASSQHLWKSTNQGQSWAKISPDLTRNDPKTLGDSGGPITKDQNGPEIYGTIFSIAPSRRNALTIWTGSDDGLVQITRDGGKSWKNVTPQGMGEFNRVSLIEASPHTAGGAYVAGKRYQMGDRSPYIFRTKDYGATWMKIVNGIPGNDFVQAVREDTVRPGLLYAGTEHGIYISFDDGANWQPISLNLPDTQVSDLVVEKDDLVIGTHGRGFWVLEGIGTLRQITPETMTRKTQVFQPRPLIRGLSTGLVDYYLSSAARRVEVELLDSTGKSAGKFESGATAGAGAGAEAEEGENGPATARRPGAHAGINRFTWTPRYPGATGFPGIVYRGATPGQGPQAPPGTYTVVITVDGERYQQPLTIRRDPRLPGVTDKDLREQFDLAAKIRDKLSQANEAVIRIRTLKNQLGERMKPPLATAFKAQAETIRTQLDAVEEEIYQVRNRSPRDTLNYPIKLNNQLAVLQTYVDTGSSRPTDQEYLVFKELSANLDAILGKLGQVVSGEMGRLNIALEAIGLLPIR